MAPLYLQDLLHYAHHGHTLRLNVPETFTRYGQRAFSVIGPKIYNSLPRKIKESHNLLTFKSNLKTYLFQKNDFELNYES